MTREFPVKRSVAAFVLVPFVHSFIYVLNIQINTFAKPQPPWMQGEPFFTWSLLGFAVLISLPAYLAFLVLGVPALYCLYRFRSGSYWSFAVVGLIIASIAWLVLGIGPRAHSPHQYWNYKISELSFAGPVGALCGILTRLIILGTGKANPCQPRPLISSVNDFECAIPILNVKNFAISLDYYTQKLGFRQRWVWGDPPVFGCVTRGKVDIFLCQGAQGQPGMWMSIFLDDVDALYTEYQTTGALIRLPPTNMPWGTREMNIQDPDGHRFRIGSDVTCPADEEGMQRFSEMEST